MQTGQDQLAQQQRIMQAKGFYKGKIDGIWGPSTMEGKVRWERSGKFSPAIPNNGLPLGDRGPYPKGVYKNPQTGFLTCAELEAESVKKATVVVKAAPQPVEEPKTE